MPTTTTKKSGKGFDYKSASQTILKNLRRDRDRQVIAKRFGFDLAKKQTLEHIGRTFGITRERVRQIEKATLGKLKGLKLSEVARANEVLLMHLEAHGGVALTSKIAAELGAETPQKQSYVVFLATLSPDIEVISEDDGIKATLAITKQLDAKKIRELGGKITEAVKALGKPSTPGKIKSALDFEIENKTLVGLLEVNKALANFEDNWGLISWPEVNPKSIRDKTYLVMGKHGKPMHFTEISERIKASNFKRRNVTVQAVHNELIKDVRFVLIGRGIYALAEWGYTPGTVADIIVEILREESPLHKDEIIRRVLDKRQVRTTTIILNLQEKDHFVRVAKATYKLKNQA